MDIEEVGRQIVDSAIKVHRTIGPGLLESAYQSCMAHELRKRGLRVECEVDLPIRYGELNIIPGYRLDMDIEDSVIIENKSVEVLSLLHEAQLLPYLRMRDCRLGFLINWNVRWIKNGIRRMVNQL